MLRWPKPEPRGLWARARESAGSVGRVPRIATCTTSERDQTARAQLHVSLTTAAAAGTSTVRAPCVFRGERTRFSADERLFCAALSPSLIRALKFM